MQVLEDHAILWANSTHVGFGLLGEQGQSPFMQPAAATQRSLCPVHTIQVLLSFVWCTDGHVGSLQFSSRPFIETKNMIHGIKNTTLLALSYDPSFVSCSECHNVCHCVSTMAHPDTLLTFPYCYTIDGAPLRLCFDWKNCSYTVRLTVLPTLNKVYTKF